MSVNLLKTSISNIGIAIGLVLALNSCKSPLSFSEGSYMRAPEMRDIQYSYSSRKQNPEKYLVVLKDEPDTNQNYYKGLIELFHKDSYGVLIIGKPGPDTYKKRALDAREERIEDVVRLLNSSDSLIGKDMILLGIGQGAYLIPELSKRLQVKGAIMINAGVLSPLAELEYLCVEDSLSVPNQKLLNYYGLEPLELCNRIDNIKKEPFGSLQLAPSSNRCWLSYYNSPVLDQLSTLRAPIYWYNFANYPGISSTGLKIQQNILRSYNSIKYTYKKNKGAEQQFWKSELSEWINN